MSHWLESFRNNVEWWLTKIMLTPAWGKRPFHFDSLFIILAKPKLSFRKSSQSCNFSCMYFLFCEHKYFPPIHTLKLCIYLIFMTLTYSFTIGIFTYIFIFWDKVTHCRSHCVELTIYPLLYSDNMQSFSLSFLSTGTIILMCQIQHCPFFKLEKFKTVKQ